MCVSLIHVYIYVNTCKLQRKIKLNFYKLAYKTGVIVSRVKNWSYGSPKVAIKF